MTRNAQILLARRPEGVPVKDDFRFHEGQRPECGEGQVVLRQLYLSLDPAIRGWMNAARSYLPPIEIGAPIRSGTLSQIVESRLPKDAPFQVGDIVQALAAWEEFTAADAQQLMGRVEPREGIPLPGMLNVLGGNGLTAYFGLHEIGRPRPGETVLVSAAAGGVGSIVGQLARIAGCRAVGITGSDDKATWLVNELGFDAAVNYRTGDLRAAVKEACPDGVDVFFDGVGGEILDVALSRLALHARVVICGAISQINNTKPSPGPKNYMQLMAKRARMEGFVTLDYHARYDEARDILAQHVRDGALRSRDEIVDGIDNAPAHMLRLFSGDHRGKLMVHVADPIAPAELNQPSAGNAT